MTFSLWDGAHGSHIQRNPPTTEKLPNHSFLKIQLWMPSQFWVEEGKYIPWVRNSETERMAREAGQDLPGDTPGLGKCHMQTVRVPLYPLFNCINQQSRPLCKKMSCLHFGKLFHKRGTIKESENSPGLCSKTQAKKEPSDLTS